jgi:hypothetical protein
LILGLLVELFGVPFAYAKTIRPTVFPTASIAVNGVAEDGNDSIQLEGDNASTVSDRSPASMEKFQILSIAGERTVLYHRGDAKIWLVPNDAMGVIKIEGEEDVLEIYLQENLETRDPDKNDQTGNDAGSLTGPTAETER